MIKQLKSYVVLMAVLACGGLLHGESIEQVLTRYKLTPLIYVDASVAESMELDTNGKVTAWRDLSGNLCDLSGYTTAKGTRVRYAGGRYPGAWVYDMGAVGSGIDMKLANDLTIGSLVMVMDIACDIGAFFLGRQGSGSGQYQYPFHRGADGQYSRVKENDPWRLATGWENGVQIPSMTANTPETGNLSIYTFNLKGTTAWNRLSQDRTQSGRNGGRKLALLMCFSSTLSTEARQDLEAAIRAKLTNPQPEVKVARQGFQPDGTYALNLTLDQAGVGASTADIYLSVGESVNALGEETQVGASVARDAPVAQAVSGLSKERTYFYRVRAVNDQNVESVSFGRLTDPVEATLADLGLVPQTHFDAANEFSFETNATGEVIRWNSVENPALDFARWTSTADGTNFGCRRLYGDTWQVYDMGATGSGIDLARRSGELTSKAVVMAVDIAPKMEAFFLGHSGTTASSATSYNFHRGTSDAQYSAGSTTACAGWFNAAGWENGIPIEGMSTSKPKTGEISVYLFNMTAGGRWDRFTQDRNIQTRNGGRKLGELMTFAENLTDEQRLALQVALMKKWRSQEAVTALWTGSAGDGDFANAGNWCCSNDLGEVSGVLPSALTAVTIPGEKVMDLTDGTSLVCKSISVAGPFARDCDWRGVTAELVGSFDLNGHALHLASVNGLPRFLGAAYTNGVDGTHITLTACPSTVDDATGTVTMAGTFSIATPAGTGTLVLDELTTANAIAVLGLRTSLDCHYDASDAANFVIDDQGGVTTWNNLSQYWDRNLISYSPMAKPARRLYQGRWVCDFGAVDSGVDLRLKSDGEFTFQAAVLAMDLACEADAFFFGHTSTYQCHRNLYGAYAQPGTANAGWSDAAGWENGVRVSMTNDVPHTGTLSIYTFNLTEAIAWNRASKDRDCLRRNGGRKVGEMMLFTRQLCPDERQVLEKIMTVKWRPRTPTTATWTGNGNDNNLTNPRNWDCANDEGPLPGVLPTETTSVTVPDGWSLDIPTNTAFVCKDLTLNGSLTRDCDWRGLTGYVRGQINLRGHKLQLNELKGAATILSAQTAYRHYKFEVFANQGGALFQISELKLYSGLADVTQRETKNHVACSGSATTFAGQGHDAALDNDVTTKWCVQSYNAANPPTIILSYDEPVLVTHYAWYTGGDTQKFSERNLKDWRLSGSNDGTTWVTLDDCANVSGLRSANSVCAFTGFTYTPEETMGEVSFTVPVQKATYNSTFAFGGAVKLVKQGGGTFYALRTFQGYAGGTDVTEGTCAMDTYHGTSLPYGKRNARITVSTSATFDIRGLCDERWYKMVLNGGTLANTGADVPNVNGCAGEITLAQDASLNVAGSFPLWGTVDLNEHTLTVGIGTGKTLYLHQNGDTVGGIFTNGTVNITEGGWFCVDSAPGGLRDMRTVNFTFNVPLNLQSSINVRDLTMIWDANEKSGSGAVNIYGTFTPSAHNYLNNFVMQDGSTLNLAAWDGVYDIAASVATGQTLGFVNDETTSVKVALGTRKVKSEEKIIAWPEGEKPNVKFIAAEGTKRCFISAPDGLYVTRGLSIFVR